MENINPYPSLWSNPRKRINWILLKNELSWIPIWQASALNAFYQASGKDTHWLNKKEEVCEEQSVVILWFGMLHVLLWQVQWNDSQTGTPWKGHKTEIITWGRVGVVIQGMCALSTTIILLLCLGEVKLCWAMCRMKNTPQRLQRS